MTEEENFWGKFDSRRMGINVYMVIVQLIITSTILDFNIYDVYAFWEKKNSQQIQEYTPQLK